MKKISFVIVLLMAIFNCFSQVAIKNSSGAIVTGDFENCFNMGDGLSDSDISEVFGNCTFIKNETYCGWDVSGDFATFCQQDVSPDDPSHYFFAHTGKKNGVLSKVILNDEVKQPTISANFTGLTAGTNYKLDFYHLNLSAIGGGNPDLDCGFSITIGDESFYVPAGDFVPFQPIYNQFSDWIKATVTFCATTSTIPFSIKAEIINMDNNNMSCYLGIDTISLVANPESTETCVIPCLNCTSFELVPEKEYLISGWVKQTDTSYVDIKTPAYSNTSFIEVIFYDSFENQLPGTLPFYPTGEIIDGWQKIVGAFTVPATAGEISIGLMNNSSNLAFFDDIRVHPFNGNLKSFVYDQGTQKLMAELDENNYATFYEYDKEGGLVRVKKETEKGVFTIQETRSSNRKKED